LATDPGVQTFEETEGAERGRRWLKRLKKLRLIIELGALKDEEANVTVTKKAIMSRHIPGTYPE